MPIPEFTYTFTRAAARRRVDIPSILREWHRASLLGIELASLEIDGKPVAPGVLRLVNAWTSARGAWSASRQGYFEAWHRLEVVLTRRPAGRRRRAGGRADP